MQSGEQGSHAATRTGNYYSMSAFRHRSPLMPGVNLPSLPVEILARNLIGCCLMMEFTA